MVIKIWELWWEKQKLNWEDANEIFKAHETKKYYQDTLISADQFLKISKGEAQDVASQINSERKETIAENRSKLRLI